jgi:cytochrome P450
VALTDEASSTIPASAIDFDHTDPAFLQNPYRTFHELHQRCPVAYSTRFDGFWVLSRYTDIIAVARDTDIFCSAQGISLPVVGTPVPLVPLESDPPLHAEFRRILQREFSRGRMQAIEGAVRDCVNALIDGFIGRGSADLAVELASPVPSIVIAQLMGFPESDWARFRDITERLLATAKAEDIPDTLDTNLTGVWHTMVAATPHLIASGGGSIICTGSTGGVKGLPFLGPYSAAKHGVVGIAKSMANELAVHNIRINVVHPSSVDTPILGGRGADAGTTIR